MPRSRFTGNKSRHKKAHCCTRMNAASVSNGTLDTNEMPRVQRSTRLRRPAGNKNVPGLLDTGKSSSSGATNRFPDGFWDWTADKQEQWVMKWFNEVAKQERDGRVQAGSGRVDPEI